MTEVTGFVDNYKYENRWNFLKNPIATQVIEVHIDVLILDISWVICFVENNGYKMKWIF